MAPGPLPIGPARKMVYNPPKIIAEDQLEGHFVTMPWYCRTPDSALGFLAHGFLADRKSPILRVPPAPAARQPLPTSGALRATPVEMGFRAPGPDPENRCYLIEASRPALLKVKVKIEREITPGSGPKSTQNHRSP